jgi:hypothetical protein
MLDMWIAWLLVLVEVEDTLTAVVEAAGLLSTKVLFLFKPEIFLLL